MFEEPGIGVDDLTWIQRDQFVYYVEMEHELSGPRDWPRFRDNLVEALNAAFGLDSVAVNADPTAAQLTMPSRRLQALEVLEEIRSQHDPATDWSRFFDALWESRRALRDDL